MAAVAMAATLPLSGPVLADSGTASAVAEIAASGTALPDAPAPDVPAPLTAAAPQFEPIGEGMASYYGSGLAGNRTASGDRFDPGALTAAHRTLPFGTQVQVTNEATGDSVIVTINDRGPFHGNRVIDLSEAAARQIGLTRSGSGRVELAVVSAGN